MQQTEFVTVKHLGVVLDKPEEEVGPEQWTGCKNFSFYNETAVRTPGWKVFGPALSITEPQFVYNVIADDVNYWIVCGKQTIKVTDGSSVWDITPDGGLGASLQGYWTGCTINGFAVVNNPANPPLYWDGNTANKMLVLPGWNANDRCKVIRASRYHIIAFNIVEDGVPYGDLVWWSSAAAPGTVPQEWTPTTENDAGDVVLADSSGEIVDAQALRDGFMVYKNYTSYVMQYVGGSFVFTARKVFDNLGAAGNNAVAELNGEHWVFTGSDLVRHDGQHITPVARNVFQKYLQEVEPPSTYLSCIVADQTRQQITLAIPGPGSDRLNRAVIVDAMTGLTGLMDIPDVVYVGRGVVFEYAESPAWDDDAESWNDDETWWNQQFIDSSQNSLMMVDMERGVVLTDSQAQRHEGVAVNAFVERRGTVINDYSSIKLITQIEPKITGVTGEVIYVTLGTQDKFGDPVTWLSPIPFVIGQDRLVHSIISGRLLSVRFEGTTDHVWELHRYAVRVADLGEY